MTNQEMQMLDLGTVAELVAPHLRYFEDRVSVSQVCKRWREALLPSTNLWIVDMYRSNYDNYLNISTLSSFQLFLKKRKYTRPIMLQAGGGSALISQLLDTLKEHKALNIPEELNLMGAEEIPHELTQLCSLQRLTLTGVNIQFQPNTLATLTSLTRLDIGSNAITFERNCVPVSLLAIKIERETMNGLLVQGFEHLLTPGLTSLKITNAFNEESEDAHTYWDFYDPVWNLKSLQHLDIDFCINITGLLSPWPEELSRLTTLTYLRLGEFADYSAFNASISTLKELRTFVFEFNQPQRLVREEDVPDGTFQLPLLNNLCILSRGALRVTNPSIWKMETVEVELEAFDTYDYSLALLEEPRIKELKLGHENISIYYNDDTGHIVPDAKAIFIKILDFVSDIQSLKRLTLKAGIVNHRTLMKNSMEQLIAFARKRPDVEMKFCK